MPSWQGKSESSRGKGSWRENNLQIPATRARTREGETVARKATGTRRGREEKVGRRREEKVGRGKAEKMGRRSREEKERRKQEVGTRAKEHGR